MTHYNTILLDISDGIARLTLNRPEKLNGLTNEMSAELLDAVNRVGDDPSARVLVMTGAGRAFSCGADLSASDIKPGDVDAGEGLREYLNPLVETLWALPKPFMTLINGPAAGAGCSLGLLGDIVIAGESAFFLQAFVNIGLVPDVGATWLLPRQIGRARALAMMMLGERVSALDAERWGMIWKCVPDLELTGVADRIAQKLASGPTRSLGMIRQGMFESLTADLHASLEIEARHQSAAGFHPNFAEGVAAFLAKRPARFLGV